MISMMSNGHKDFIESPIEEYIYTACSACSSVGSGIETYPLSEYVLQSLFLNLTGSQEQKFKCLCWEIASLNFDFRYETYTANSLGECSNLDERNKIYKRIVNNYNIQYNEDEKKSILQDAQTRYESVTKDTMLVRWLPQDYNNASKIINSVRPEHLLVKDKLFKTDSDENKSLLSLIYKNSLYKHRNRCAHNLLSYQNNLPSLKVLSDSKNKYNNYFVFFYVLILIDVILRNLYEKVTANYSLY